MNVQENTYAKIARSLSVNGWNESSEKQDFDRQNQIIDKSNFRTKLDPSERERLRGAKMENRKSLRDNGFNRKKYMNVRPVKLAA